MQRHEPTVHPPVLDRLVVRQAVRHRRQPYIYPLDEVQRLLTAGRGYPSPRVPLRYRRLNSYAKQHPLYQALVEFGEIPTWDFILRFVDGIELRQAIAQQMNKGESANKFSRAIVFGNYQDFLYGKKSRRKSPRSKTPRGGRNSSWRFMKLLISLFGSTEVREMATREWCFFEDYVTHG